MNRVKKINTTKSSDRRLAGSRQAAQFLHSSFKPTTKIVPADKVPISSEKTVKRKGGGKTWEDSSLLEWDPAHFRLFVGNLGPDANDQLLAGAFGKYATMSKVKVPLDNKTGKNKGYGFVAFSSADDYFKAFKEMNGKYIGLHPVQLKRAETKIKAVKKK
ncbi:RNA-binding domain-containing protein [Suhomyces tanzawaensis NRRL Y-17324]|uniref:RNA-binding domain-containing protein n=1 Tax=Suhomyces tanzawaensis NRRL Y-17324 TaxID=984487 RepID=A0A1E4SG99_9ASCO|nr:RNA-binding domain-containing protein [Suhomyces tanzawaensis NRRL Y-17324]ODV78538.1 RNA-binding domain-containing protein [Suhomyces tanzawaensis NRRL Y-17324]